MKKWLVLAGLAIGMVCAMLCVKLYPTKAAEDATQTNGVFTLEQLTDNSYTGAYTSNRGELLNTDNDAKYSVIAADGSVYELDNTAGKYGSLSIGTGSSALNILYSRNSENKRTILNFDGTYYGGLKGYYSNVNLSINSYKGEAAGDYYYTDDAGTTHFCTKNGTEIATFKLADSINNIMKLGDNYIIETNKGDEGLYNCKGELNSNFNSATGRFNFRVEVCFDWYQYVDDSYTGSDVVTFRGRKCIEKYYNSNLQEVTKAENDELFKNFNYGEKYANNFKYLQKENQYSLPDNYTAKYTGTVSGIDVVVGFKDVDAGPTYALFYKNGTMILGNLYSINYFYNNVVIVKDGGNYKAIRLNIPGSKPAQEATTAASTTASATSAASATSTQGATSSNTSGITSDGNGNQSAGVVAANSDNDQFSMIASENVIPAGSKFSVTKVVSGTAYDATKQVIQDVADKFVVYNIDLLNSENVKIEPDGTIQITMPIPEGYNTGSVSVYRLSDDNKSYVKLPSNVVNGKVVFTTDHFSTYVLAQDKESVDTNSTTPVTADMSNIPLLLAVIAFAALAIVVSVGKKYSTK